LLYVCVAHTHEFVILDNENNTLWICDLLISSHMSAQLSSRVHFIWGESFYLAVTWTWVYRCHRVLPTFKLF